ncbi:Ankyrin repeat domain-containing protein 17 [Colletotrichum sp. SAR11_57]|nr:Ankyrin repeat domain-containing protein 17 [Colletotrichum sp. SAR11_57]
MQRSLPPLDAAWDPTLQTDDGEEYCWTPLQLAARGGELENIREILAANPEAVNDPPRGYYGQTAIQAACMHGHEQAVQMLVDAGADIHFCGGNNFQRNALQIACGHGNEKVVDILLSAGAKVNEVLSEPAHPAHGLPASSVVVTRYNGRTALQAAAERGHEHLVSRLLRLEADVNAPPSPTAGFTALQAAAGGGYMTILKLLLQHGADINGASAKYKGYTALQGACLGGLPLRVSDPAEFTSKLAVRPVLEVTAQRPPETAAGATRKTLPVVNDESPPLSQALNVEWQRLSHYKSDLVDLKPLNLQDLAEMQPDIS